VALVTGAAKRIGRAVAVRLRKRARTSSFTIAFEEEAVEAVAEMSDLTRAGGDSGGPCIFRKLSV